MDYLTYLKERGCDTQAALNRLNNDAEFYRSCIELILNDQNLNELKKAIEEQDIKNAFFKAHTLKGILANLSFTPYYEKISQIVEILRNNSFDGVKDRVDDFDQFYTEFIEELGKKI